MCSRYLFILAATLALSSCRKYTGTDYPPPPPPPPPVPVLLKDIEIPRLPSPYYHFEYNAQNEVSFVSFASEFTRYDVFYSQGRISEMRNNILVNKDRLQYFYDVEGKVSLVQYADSNGVVYTKVLLSYTGQKLTKVEREKKTGNDFVKDKVLSMTYNAGGNILDITYHYLPVNGLAENTFTTRFENYDDKTNVDEFDLIHNEFFDHLVLLPGLHMQKNNPGKETRSGDGVNYVVNYTYSYNEKNLPLNKNGQVTILNGSDAGRQFQTSSIYSYY